MQRGSARQAGYGLVVLLVLLALASLGLSVAGQHWQEALRRENEQQLLRVGQLYVQALTRYRDMSPGSAKRLPEELQELLLDTRFIGTVRHLRQLYGDPVNRNAQWGVLRDDGGRIRGVYSLSSEPPLAQEGIRRNGLRMPAARRYSEWQFVVDAQS